MNNINIEHRDCFDFLDKIPKDSIDLILTDPPYIISRETGFSNVVHGVKRFAVNMEFGEWDKQEIELKELSKKFYQALKKSGTVIIFYDIWKITSLAEALKEAGFNMLRLIIWEKTNPVPLNSKRNYLTNSREIAVLGVKDSRPTFNSEYDNGIYRHAIPNSRNRLHPTQKPLKLFEELIEKHSLPGQTVLDCFLGSGTTAVASQNTGRKFIGCEIDLEYYDLSKTRILK